MKTERMENGYVRLRAEDGRQLCRREVPDQHYSEAVVRESEIPRFAEAEVQKTE